MLMMCRRVLKFLRSRGVVVVIEKIGRGKKGHKTNGNNKADKPAHDELIRAKTSGISKLPVDARFVAAVRATESMTKAEDDKEKKVVGARDAVDRQRVLAKKLLLS